MKHKSTELSSEPLISLDQQSRLAKKWLSQARMVINLPSLSAYEDTLIVVGEMSTRMKICYVITALDQELSPVQRNAWPRIQLIKVPLSEFPVQATTFVKRLIKGDGIEIIHDFFGHFSSACERYKHRKRDFIMIHTQRTTNWGWFSRVKPRGYQIDLHYAGQRTKALWNDTRILHAVDHVTVMGPGHELDLEEGHQLSTEAVSFIPSETDCERFTPAQHQELSHTLLYTGAFVRTKGLDLLLELFTHLGTERPEIKLILIGRETPFEREWFRRAIETHPLRSRIEVISFLPREALIDHYRAARLYLFPSLFEGSPRSLREAIACGTPAIASDIPGHRGIDPQGNFIRFAPVDDLSRWLGLAREALDEDEASYRIRAEDGARHLNTIHHPSVIAQQWLNLYEQVALQRGLCAHFEHGSS